MLHSLRYSIAVSCYTVSKNCKKVLAWTEFEMFSESAEINSPRAALVSHADLNLRDKHLLFKGRII